MEKSRISRLTTRNPWKTLHIQRTSHRLPWKTSRISRLTARKPWKTLHIQRTSHRLPWKTTSISRLTARKPWKTWHIQLASHRVPWKTSRISRLTARKHYKIRQNGPTGMAYLSFSSNGKRFFGKIIRFCRISLSQITHCKTRVKTSARYLAGDPRFCSEMLGKKHFRPP